MPFKYTSINIREWCLSNFKRRDIIVMERSFHAPSPPLQLISYICEITFVYDADEHLTLKVLIGWNM